jgi:hypothetical protein
MKYSYIKTIIILIMVILFLHFIYKYVKNIYGKNVEGFQNNNYEKWSPQLIKQFNIYQTTINDNVNQFDLDLLQKQATPEEALQLIKTGYWPWPDDLKNEYINKVWSSTIVKIDPYYALNYAMSIYNKNAARELLAWNTKEGHFLLYGGDLGISKEIKEQSISKDSVEHLNNTIKCTNDHHGNSVMQKKVYTGMNLWNGYMNSTTATIKPEDIPNEMPGFSFVKEPCNPCVALNSPGDYSCPFKLNVKGNDNISSIWKKLWDL